MNQLRIEFQEGDRVHPESRHPVDIHVGSRVRFRRSELEMSQLELGRRLGIAFQQVQKYEIGRNRISASRLVDIGHVLRVKPSYFFAGVGAGSEFEIRTSLDLLSLQQVACDKSMMRLLRGLACVGDQAVRARAAAAIRAVADW